MPGRPGTAARWMTPGADDLAAQDRDLMPEHQDFHVLGNIAAGEESQPAEQPDREQIGEAKEHECRG